MATTAAKRVKRNTAATARTSRVKTAAKPKAATKAPQPASMSGSMPSIVTLKHLAEWSSYDHGVAKAQAVAMFTGFVADIGRALKKGSKIRIPNLGILQVRLSPARKARKGRNPATGEEIQIKAKRASRKVAFRPAKALKDSI